MRQRVILIIALFFMCAMTLYGCGGSDCGEPVAPNAPGGSPLPKGTITGTITLNGAPAKGVPVEVTAAKLSTLTDANGRYTFSGLTYGRYKVTASPMGLTPQTKEVVLSSLSQSAVISFTFAYQGSKPYSQTFGGSEDEFIGAFVETFLIAIAAKDGTIWFCGSAASSDGDLANSNYHNNAGSNDKYRDGWLFQVDPNQNKILYSRCFGGTKTDYFTGMQLMDDGRIWLCGRSFSDDGDNQGQTHKGDGDGWLICINPKNNENNGVEYKRLIGGTGEDFLLDIKVENNIVWLCGETFSVYGDNTNNGHHGNQTSDAWVLKIDPSLNPDNQIVYNRCFGGDEKDGFLKIYPQSDGTVWLSGITGSVDGDVVGNNGAAGTLDTWLVHLNPENNNALLYNRCFGGTKDEQCLTSLFVSDSNIWLASRAYSNDGDVKKHYGADYNSDLWLLNIDTTKAPDEQILLNKNLGGTEGEAEDSISLISDQGSGIWVATDTSSADGDLQGVTRYGKSDIWLLHMNKDGNIDFNKCYGGDKEESFPAITIESGSLWCVCATKSSNSGLVPLNHGKYDAWLFNQPLK